MKRRLKELLDRVEKLQQENQTLKEENAYLKFQLKELQEKIYKKKHREEETEEDRQEKQSKKRGAPFGHLGWFRKKPKEIDVVEIVKLKQCPECGSDEITELGKPQEHIQEDIVIPKVKAVCYQKHQYYCRRCKKAVEGRGKEELPNSYIGPIAKTVAVYLKYHVKVSDRDIHRLFESLFSLKMSTGSIMGFRDQLRRYCQPLYEQLLKSLKNSSFIHADETGWRLGGKKHWLWNFSNNLISVTHIAKGRGQSTVDHLLGSQYDGILISDFLSAYNKIKTKGKQKCLVHLLRDLKRIQEALWDDSSVQSFCQRLKELLKDATQLAKAYQNQAISKTDFESKRTRLEESLKDLTYTDPHHKILQRLVKRLNQYRGELLTFLYHPGIDSNNNHAERQIRPNVLLRKITFGNRSVEGTQNHNVLMSIIQTAKLRKLDPLQFLQNRLFSFDNPNALADLIPP